MVDFAKMNADHRQRMHCSEDPGLRHRAQVLDMMDEREKKYEAMDDVEFLQHLKYCHENSSRPEYYRPMDRGSCITYDEVLHFILLPMMMKRLPRLIEGSDRRHHFLCKPENAGAQVKDGECNHRCVYDSSQDVPF